MARLGFPTSRLGGQRWRALVATGLIVAAAGAVLPGGHTAHAAALTTCTGSQVPIQLFTSATSGSQLSASNLVITLGGGNIGTVTFDAGTTGTTTPFALPIGSQVGPGSSSTFGCGNPGVNTNSFSVSGTATLAGTGTACSYDAGNSNVFTVGTGGVPGLTIFLTCGTTSVPVSFNIGLTSQIPTATPELGSGELLATGIVPIVGIAFLRRRRRKGQQ